MPQVVIVIPAAGASRRMRGTDKLLEDVGGQPLLRHQALTALATGAPVLVTLPPDAPARRAALHGLPDLAVITVPDAAEGLAASLRRAIAEVRRGLQAARPAGLMVHLADLPDIETADLTAMLTAFATAPDTILRATDADGTPGHPVIFPRRLFDQVSLLRGDTGARDILRREPPRLFALPGHRATTDLDTPEAWAAWRARQPS